jgi:hypothetical protein
MMKEPTHLFTTLFNLFNIRGVFVITGDGGNWKMVGTPASYFRSLQYNFNHEIVGVGRWEHTTSPCLQQGVGIS